VIFSLLEHNISFLNQGFNRANRIQSISPLYSVRSALAQQNIKADDILPSKVGKSSKNQEIWCFPLISYLLAINHTKRIDYFALDVAGAELSVLKSLPWEKLNIRVLQVRYNIF